MNYKRKKNKRQVRCQLCTPNRKGNTKWRFGIGTLRKLQDNGE